MTVPADDTDATLDVLASVNCGAAGTLVKEQVMIAPAFTFAAARVSALPDTGAVKLAGLVETAEFESVQVAVVVEITQAAGPVSVTTVLVLITPRICEGPVTATPGVTVVTANVVVP